MFHFRPERENERKRERRERKVRKRDRERGERERRERERERENYLYPCVVWRLAGCILALDGAKAATTRIGFSSGTEFFFTAEAFLKLETMNLSPLKQHIRKQICIIFKVN